MTTTAAETLEERALAAADAAFTRLGLQDGPLLHLRLLRSAYSLGWIEGRQAGGDEAKELVQRLTENLRS